MTSTLLHQSLRQLGATELQTSRVLRR